jgi:hypothetical protein
MPAPRIPVLLELDPDHEPIAGVLRQPPGTDAKPFTGWLELTQLLEAIRCPADSDPPHPSSLCRPHRLAGRAGKEST